VPERFIQVAAEQQVVAEVGVQGDVEEVVEDGH